MHSMKAITRLTGVKPDTLRSWERRYDLLSPERDSNGRRVYSQDDVDQLNMIAKLVRAGHAISRLALLDTPDLEALLAKVEEAPPESVRRGERSESEIRQHVNAMSEAAKSGELERFRYLAGSALTLFPPEVSLEQILAPTLRTIGTLWENGIIDVAQEHGLSAAVKEQLLGAVGTLRWSGRGRAIVFTTLSGELHEIGALMACYLAATEGHRCHYLGPNTPAGDIVRTALKTDADAVALSLVHASETNGALDEVRIIAESLPAAVRIWLGVGAHVPATLLDLPERVRLFDSYDPYRQALKSLREESPG